MNQFSESAARKNSAGRDVVSGRTRKAQDAGRVNVRGVKVALSLALCLAGCRESSDSVSQKAQVTSAAPVAASVTTTSKRPRRVFDVPFSAYRARLDFDEETLVLATSHGVHLARGDGSTTTIPRDFGDTFTLTGSTVVYFQAGRLLQSVRGGEPTVLAAVPAAPSLIALREGQVAWVERTADGGSRVATVESGAVRTVIRLSGRVDTMAVLGSWVFFFEQGRGGTWRLGGAPLDGGKPVFREWQSGRVPATLAALDELYYYEGPSRTVRRVSPDLGHEEILASGVICSPLAAADRVACAHVGGIYEIPLAGGPREDLATQTSLVSALATNGREVAWVSDSGAERLIVKAQLLAPPR